MKRHILLLVNVDWFVVSHRLNLIQAIVKSGSKVTVVCGTTDVVYQKQIQDVGADYISIKFERGSLRLSNLVKIFTQIFKVLQIVKPDVVHAVTVVPIFCTGLLSFFYGRGCKFIYAFSGMGSIFVDPSGGKKLGNRQKYRPLRWFLLRLIGVFRGDFIVQNEEDRRLLRSYLCSNNGNRIHLFKGSGVDLKLLRPRNGSKQAVTFSVGMISRLLVDKGIKEYLAAIDTLTDMPIKIEFFLMGDLDPGNPTSLTEKERENLAHNRQLKWLGHIKDIASIYRHLDLVVLPSYREGMPKTILEAAACGLPVVTTDVVGCRDAILPGKTGLLVPPRDAVALANAIKFFALNPSIARKFGREARKFAEANFDQESIVSQHLRLYTDLRG